MPLKYLDVLRTTYTDLETEAESQIEDFWTESGARELSDSWRGKTVLHILHPPAPPGLKRIHGRYTKIQQTSRPDNLWPEVWQSMSKKQKEKAKSKWEIEKVKRKDAREKHGVVEVSPDDNDYLKILSKLRLLSQPKAPAMPVVRIADPNIPKGCASSTESGGRLQAANDDSSAGGNIQPKAHQDHVSPKGFASEEWYALVHTPVPIPKAMLIPEAKAGLEKEWNKLEVKKAWNIDKVKPKAEVIAQAKRNGRPVHFGSLMDLCHVKNSQLGKEFWTYKGRVVFRGDIVKDENGQYAIFTEQGASASNMAAAKFMDAIARMPGNDGEDSDAVGAYTQVRLSDAAKLLGKDDVITETWISLPPHRRPKSWANIQDPVCPLELNLYGHPLAGLLWEIHQESILLKSGFVKVKGWECLYVNRPKMLFISAYVDDYKMAGKKCNIKPMWDQLRKEGLDLEPSVSLKSNVYLGCGQREVKPDLPLIAAKREMFTRLCMGDNKGKPEEAAPPKDLKENFETSLKIDSQTKSKKIKKNKSGASGSKDQAGHKANAGAVNHPISAYVYEMFGHMQQSVDRYLELAGKTLDSLKKVPTPCIDDHLIPPEEFEVKGHLSSCAARVVLKALYVARIARYDIMWAVNVLAREVTRWTAACDRRLHRLISYMHHTFDWAQYCYVGDLPSECWLTLFSDASFAGDLRDSKSTSGGILCLVGPHTYVPISWICKKQGAVSHSTAEAEVISLDAGVRLEGLPALLLWELVIDVFEPLAKSNKPKELALEELMLLRRKNL